MYFVPYTVCKRVNCFPKTTNCSKLENGQYLFLSQNGLFLAVKNRKIWIFAPKLAKKCDFMVFWGSILGQNPDFWPKSFIIWYILESKIQEYYWILAKKIQIRRFARFSRFCKIKFLDKLWLLTQCEFCDDTYSFKVIVDFFRSFSLHCRHLLYIQLLAKRIVIIISDCRTRKKREHIKVFTNCFHLGPIFFVLKAHFRSASYPTFQGLFC